MDVFQSNISVVNKIWHEDKNYRIWDLDNGIKRCLILFSSNGIYAPNTEEAFVEKIINNDRYEFQNIAKDMMFKKRFGRIIFVRDLWRAWYVRGINDNADSIEKTIHLLYPYVRDYELYTAGISSGGYMVVIAGIKLNAKAVYNFSGQFRIEKERRKGIIGEYEEDNEKNVYFDLVPLIEQATIPIFYFFPGNSEWDKTQSELVKDCKNIYRFEFRHKEHGNTVLTYNFKYIFCMNINKLVKYSTTFHNKQIGGIIFLILTGGVRGLFDCMIGLKSLLLKHKRGKNEE